MSEHILFVVNKFPPYTGGLEQHVFELARHLASQGTRCTVVTLSSVASDTVEHGIRVIRLPQWGNIGDVISFPKAGIKNFLSKLIDAENVTSISVHTRFFPMTWAGVGAGLKTKVPVILTEHGSSHVRGVSPLVRIASWLVDKTMGRWSLKKATARLAVSSDSARFVQRLAGKSADVFLNAINVDFWRVGSAEKPQRFVFVGRIVPDKGWDESVRAFEEFRHRNPSSQYELHIVGDGPEFERLAAQVDASQAKENIFVHGRKSHEEVRFLLNGQWLINPTTLAEGFQTTLIEAAVCNAGIISYEVPGLDELSNSGATILRASSFENLAPQMEASLKIVPSALSEASADEWGWGMRARQYLKVVDTASCP